MPAARTTIILAVLFSIGLGFIFLFEVHTESTAEQQKFSGRVLRVTNDDIERLRIRRDHWTSALLERSGPDLFRVSEPSPRAIDASQVQKLLSTIEFLEHRSLLQGEARRADRLYELGLNPARLEIDLGLADGRELRLLIGKEPPLGKGNYLRVHENDDLFLVDATLLRQAEQVLELASGEVDLEQGRNEARSRSK